VSVLQNTCRDSLTLFTGAIFFQGTTKRSCFCLGAFSSAFDVKNMRKHGFGTARRIRSARRLSGLWRLRVANQGTIAGLCAPCLKDLARVWFCILTAPLVNCLSRRTLPKLFEKVQRQVFTLGDSRIHEKCVAKLL